MGDARQVLRVITADRLSPGAGPAVTSTAVTGGVIHIHAPAKLVRRAIRVENPSHLPSHPSHLPSHPSLSLSPSLLAPSL